MNKIEDLFDNWISLSKKQRKLCNYMISNTDILADISAEEIAKNAGVSKATLFRLLHGLKYSSLGLFKVDLINHISHSPYPNYWQMERRLTNKNETSGVNSSVHNIINILDNMVIPSFELSFKKTIDILEQVIEIGVIGCRSSNFLAQYFETLMLTTSKRVSVLSIGESFALDRINKLSTESAVIVIARWPYSRLTIDAAQYAYKLGHSIILLTNNGNCDLKDIAKEILLLPMTKEQYSIVPFVTVIEALVDGMCLYNKSQTLRNIDRINSALQKYNVIEW